MEEAPPPIVAVVSVSSQVILNVEGIRMRMSLAAVISGLAVLSVIVIVSMAVVLSPTVKLWFAAEEITGAASEIVAVPASSGKDPLTEVETVTSADC